MRECKTCKHADFSVGAVFCCTICKCPLEIRNEMLEEAAKKIESKRWENRNDCAEAIRKLKEE